MTARATLLTIAAAVTTAGGVATASADHFGISFSFGTGRTCYYAEPVYYYGDCGLRDYVYYDSEPVVVYRRTCYPRLVYYSDYYPRTYSRTRVYRHTRCYDSSRKYYRRVSRVCRPHASRRVYYRSSCLPTRHSRTKVYYRGSQPRRHSETKVYYRGSHPRRHTRSKVYYRSGSRPSRHYYRPVRHYRPSPRHHGSGIIRYRR
jgi:hypothetical protein